ncbi:hypothetical protein J2S13_000934 [Oikeobacillus pervagus]|uniref:G5 domain-containing protein n=1 Tax=Oikeobacillus pervagus TaxID=1325931 RepID=A0AAJ1SXC7_9BACI|nr:G5 domain-containing protein [Oikeobacillus pervagus]MDQ0214538.1 hypothetical protein [Oikeobacillus pervagus]
MKDIQFIKVFISMVLLTTYFITFSHYGAFAYEKVFLSSSTFAEGTKIGPVDVSEKTKPMSLKILNNQIDKWKQEAKLSFQYVEKHEEMDVSMIEIRKKDSVAKAVSGETNPLMADVSEKQLKSMIAFSFPQLDLNTFDLQSLQKDLADIGSYLQKGETVIDLTLYLKEQKKRDIVAERLFKHQVGPDLQDFIHKHSSIKVTANAVFSFNEWIEKTGFRSLEEDDLNLLSTSLFQIIMQSNFLILEKNQSESLPGNIELGTEAKVQPEKNLNFSFMNPNDQEYIIEMKMVNGKLYMALKGIPFAYQYKMILKNKETIAPKVVVRYSPSLPFNEMKVKTSGKKGLLIQVYRVASELNDKYKEEKISEDFYPPVHRVEIHSSLKPPEPKQVEEEDSKESTQQPKSDQLNKNEPNEGQKDNETKAENKQQAS